MADEPTTNIVQTTAQVVSAYVGRHQIPVSEVPGLIKSVYAAINAGSGPAATLPDPIKLTPAQIRKSITHDAIISFEDQKPYRVLKRHLTTLGLTPAQYRAKWGLPPDYPMTAASYSAKRSAFALEIGLGRKPAAKAPPAASMPVPRVELGKAADATAKPPSASRKRRAPRAIDPAQ